MTIMYSPGRRQYVGGTRTKSKAQQLQNSHKNLTKLPQKSHKTPTKIPPNAPHLPVN